MSDRKTKGETWLDVGHFGWFVRYEYSDTWLDFVAYEAIAEGVHPDPGKKWFERKGGRGGLVQTDNPDEAEEVVSGYIKWDGCAEYTMAHQHFCGADDVKKFANGLIAVHRMALLLPSIDMDCAGYDAATVSESEGTDK